MGGRFLNRPLTRVISVSEYSARCLRDLGVLAPDRMLRIYNGVDLTRVPVSGERTQRFRHKHGIAPGRAIVTQISWVIPEKGVDDFLSAARLVLSRNPQVHFVVAGDGAQRDELVARAGNLGLADHLTWTGRVEDPFEEGVFEAADVVCQLSRWEEVFGWSIAEAMAFAKPIVATQVGGIPEIVEHGVSGFLVARRDVAAAADRILTLVADPELRARMGRAARQQVEAQFDLAANVALLIEAYGLD
jgi:glycosyltransferase involved in cell wall biosynthesis